MQLNPTSDTYNNLLLAYKFMNEHLFQGILPICLITLQREKKSYGYFCKNKFMNNSDPSKCTDEIALNPQHFRSDGRDDRMVVSTLVHEMCHLWQSHFGDPGRSRYHNKEWADKMKSLGLIPSSTGAPGGKETGDHMSHYIQENGLFSKVFQDLLVQGFALQWIEQYIENETGISPPLPNIPGLKTHIENNSSSDNCSDDNCSDNNIPVFPKPDKSNRLKYTCPDCQANAWAKPGINIICGDCNKQMIYLF
ncbi:MAG: SprT family zinc-dependent metalloprotease [Fibrobacter sp.]|nr:SprT family zinc-dependent metalloprotease [Fibrobacter sp.]